MKTKKQTRKEYFMEFTQMCGSKGIEELKVDYQVTTEKIHELLDGQIDGLEDGSVSLEDAKTTLRESDKKFKEAMIILKALSEKGISMV